MAYSFKHVEHQVYQNTFLKDVRVAVEFSAIDVATVDTSKLQRYFDKFNGAEIKSADFLDRGSINVFSSDHTIDFHFGLGYAEAKLDTPPYTSFDDAESYWHILMDFLAAIDVRSVSRLMVRKFNALYFTTNTREYDMREVMNGLFCDDLMKTIPQGISSDKSLNSFEWTWTDSADDGKSEVEVVNGIKKADATVKKDHLTMVTLIKSKDLTISVDDVMKLAKEYNQILFDMFHWCVKDDIINTMKQKQ